MAHHTTSQTSHLTTSHITSRKKKTHRRSSWAEFLGGRMAHHTTSQTSHHTTSHITSRKKRTQRRSCWAEFLGRIGEISPHHTSHISSHHITHHTFISHHIKHHKEEVLRVFSCEPPSRASQKNEKDENYHVKRTSKKSKRRNIKKVRVLL